MRISDAVISVYELDLLLAVATQYLDTFGDDELMTLPERLLYEDVTVTVEKYGRRY